MSANVNCVITTLANSNSFWRRTYSLGIKKMCNDIFGPNRRSEQESYDWITFVRFTSSHQRKKNKLFSSSLRQCKRKKFFFFSFVLHRYARTTQGRYGAVDWEASLLWDRIHVQGCDDPGTDDLVHLLSSPFYRFSLYVLSVSSIGPEWAATASSFVHSTQTKVGRQLDSSNVQWRLIAIKCLGEERPNGPLEMTI